MCDNTSRSVFLCRLQIRQQCPGLWQVLRLKPFGEPRVDLGYQRVGVGIVNLFALMQYQGKEEAICPLLPLKRPGLES
jgi:hypothetical protein